MMWRHIPEPALCSADVRTAVLLEAPSHAVIPFPADVVPVPGVCFSVHVLNYSPPLLCRAHRAFERKSCIAQGVLF